MTELVVTTPQQLAEQIEEAVRRAFDSHRGSPWLTAEQASQYLQVSAELLRELCDNGDIQYGVAGRRRRFHRNQLDAYLTRTV